MIWVAALALLAVVSVWIIAKRRKRTANVNDETSAELESWIVGAVERELGATFNVWGDDAHKSRLGKTLRGEPDVDLVSNIEEKIRAIDVEYVRYAHESDCGVKLSMRFENGDVRVAERRLALDALPASVRRALTEGGATRAFRAWDFPWAR
jgi:hypothetical protein